MTEDFIWKMTSKGQLETKAASLQDLESGLFGSTSLTEGRVHVPSHVELAGEYVLWRFADYRSATSRGMLDALVSLSTTKDVESYVLRYGPVNFCQRHRLPVGHNAVPENPVVDGSDSWQMFAGRPSDAPRTREELDYIAQFCMVDRVPGTWTQREFVSSYFKLAAQLRAGMRIAHALKSADLNHLKWADIGSEDDWREFTFGVRGRPYVDEHQGQPLNPRVPPTPTDLYLARGCLGTQLNILSAFARMRPSVLWSLSRGPEFVIAADQFGTLLIQLNHAISGTHALALCSGCGNVYARMGRKPAAGRRNYCPNCHGRGVAWRDAKRDERAGLSKPRKPKGS